MSESKTFNMDCMEAMKKFPDKYFDLAVVDPPYGSADSDLWGGVNALAKDLINTRKIARTGGTWAEKYGKKS